MKVEIAFPWVVAAAAGLVGGLISGGLIAFAAFGSSDWADVATSLMGTVATLSVGIAAWRGLQRQISLQQAQTQFDLMTRRREYLDEIISYESDVVYMLRILATQIKGCATPHDIPGAVGSTLGIFPVPKSSTDNGVDVGTLLIGKFDVAIKYDPNAPRLPTDIKAEARQQFMFVLNNYNNLKMFGTTSAAQFDFSKERISKFAADRLQLFNSRTAEREEVESAAAEALRIILGKKVPL